MNEPTPPHPDSGAPGATPERRVVAPNFITEIIDRDLREGRVDTVVTRFPPEPNGYLHIGHAKAICLDFGVADDRGGRTNLRFDDTNPTTEDEEYVEAIKADVRWLGFEWDEVRFASDYFGELYRLAQRLVERGLAYVDSLSEEEIREYRGSVTEAGRESPYRDRSVEENLELFERMRRGDFPEGAHVLRARIDMASPNMLMRDPLLYRIRHAHHYRTGDAWHVYPMYDFAHPLSDAIEGVTHSLCSLEFENNREVYDWLVERLVEAGELERPRPHQYEFARLNLDYTVLSKRKLIALVRDGHVSGWDDPRMPTIAGLRRRGVTPAAIRDFANRVGVTKANSRTDYGLLEYAIRDDLNTRAPRVMAVTDPLPLTLTNWPEDRVEQLDAPYWPHDVPREGSRALPFGRLLAIERSDFAETPPKGWRRLSPGASVRLRHGYVVTCDEVETDDHGAVVALRGRVHEGSLGSNPEGVKVNGVIHWLHAPSALEAEFRFYDRLFSVPDPDAAEGAFQDHLNPESLAVKRGLVEPSLRHDPADTRYQFERVGYFWRDPRAVPVGDGASGSAGADAPLAFNRIVTLKDAWARRASDERRGAAEAAEAVPAKRRPAHRAGEEPDPLDALSAEQLSAFARYHTGLGLSRDDAALIAGNDALAGFFEEALQHHDNPTGVANWLVNEVQRELKERPLAELSLSAADLAQLVALVDDGVINNRIAKEVFEEVLRSGDSPRAVVAARGLEQLTDEDAIREVVGRVVDANPDEATAYRDGKRSLVGFFIGQVMRETRGTANPKLVKRVLEDALG